MDNQGKNMVVLVLCPLQGHITPMLQLGSILHAKGISISVLHSQFNSPNSSDHPQFTFLSLEDNISPKDASLSNVFQFISDVNANCRSPLRDHMVRLQGRVACVISDSAMKVAESVAEDLGLPSIIFRTCSAANLLAYRAIIQLEEENKVPLPESQLEEAVPTLGFLRFKDLPFSVASGIPKPILEFMPTSFDIRYSRAIIWNSVEILEKSALPDLQHHYQIPFFSIGPIHRMAQDLNSTSLLKEDISCVKWLDRQATASVIYVSLGSISIVGEEELIETAWGLVDSEQPFLWVIRPNSVIGSEWIECLPEELVKMINKRGCIVKWAPQKEILAHSAIGTFLSHCGWNSTLEGICEGVPMLCRPSFVDQKVNARYLISEWRVGIELENTRNRTVVKDAIRRILVDDESKKMRERSAWLKRELEDSVGKGGSSYESMEKLTQFILSL